MSKNNLISQYMFFKKLIVLFSAFLDNIHHFFPTLPSPLCQMFSITKKLQGFWSYSAFSLVSVGLLGEHTPCYD